MTSKNTPTREEIARYFDQPASTNEDLFRRIARFLRDRFGIDRFAREHMEWGRCSGWEIALDKDGKVVEKDDKTVPFENSTSVRLVRLLVSRKGPFVASETFTLVPRAGEDRISAVSDAVFKPDSVVDSRARAWGEAIAKEFGLHYLDPVELEAWKVDEDELADGALYLDSSEPTAFNILFYEY